MQKVLKLAKRGLRSSTTLAVVGFVAHGLFGHQAWAQDPPPTPYCSTLPNPIYLAGSSAVKPALAALGYKLYTAANPITLVYIGAKGSCDGVNTIVSGLKVTAGAVYWPNPGSSSDCVLPPTGQLVDVGMSDVFPTSCPDILPDSLAGIGDFTGPVQSMNFVVPKAASQVAISAEAAYLTFGLGAKGKTDWDNPALYSIRNFQSGTETMIAKAINVPTNKWLGMDQGGSTGVVKAISTPTGAADKTIGILASNEADTVDNRKAIKRLAFQPYGEMCALYPDSSFSSKDKMNVRAGNYQIWGPLHMLAKVDAQKVPTDPNAAKILDILLGKVEVAGVDVVALEIDNFTVPQCAMQVTRTEELGKPKAYSPVGACGCFFDSKTGGDVSSCKACTKAAECTGAAKMCNHGFCEVK